MVYKTKPQTETVEIEIRPIVMPTLAGLTAEDLAVLKEAVRAYKPEVKNGSGFQHICQYLQGNLNLNLKKTMTESHEGAVVFEQIKTTQHMPMVEDRKAWDHTVQIQMRSYRYQVLKCWAIRLERSLAKNGVVDG